MAMCTRVLWNDNRVAVVASRTVDWPVPTDPVLTVFPRGSRHDGGVAGGARVAGGSAACWAAVYGAVVTTFYGVATVDGVNERGLAAHLLYLSETGAPYDDFGVYNTEYRTVCDLTSRRYSFEFTTAPNVVWTDLDRLDFEPGAPVMTLDPGDISLAGEVSAAFRPAQPPY
jgi:penicillin V acylase-like amidase (Ntn superfamily)